MAKVPVALPLSKLHILHATLEKLHFLHWLSSFLAHAGVPQSPPPPHMLFPPLPWWD